MFLAMLLAHLVGDYILQWDKLSHWKSQALTGVLAHGSIVLTVTWLFILPFDPSWWPWVLFIGVTHILIDGLGLPVRRRLGQRNSGSIALALFATDQALHLSIIALALCQSGYLKLPLSGHDFLTTFRANQLLAYLLGYAFLTMPAWILVKFISCGLIPGTAPDFSGRMQDKYLGMAERVLIATLVLVGQFAFVPLVALPHLMVVWPQVSDQVQGGGSASLRRTLVHLAEQAVSIALAIATGLGLRHALG
jgi:hypothetical protein